MMRLKLLLITGLVTTLFFSTAEAFNVVVDTGEVKVSRNGEQSSITDTGSISSGDTVKLDIPCRATVMIENSSRLLLQGPSSVVISGDSSFLKAELLQGQILLDRNEPHTLDSIVIIAKDYVFRPVGTLASVRITQSGNPSVAVVKGSMKMVSPANDELVVEEGKFGGIGSEGKLLSGDLAPKAMNSLQGWADNSSGAPEKSDDQQSENAAEPVSANAESAAGNETAPEKADTPKSGNAAVSSPVSASANLSNESDAEETNEDGEEAENVKKPAEKQSPKWEIGAGVVTVDNEQWTRLAIGVDVPIWKFGVFFDLELFIDNEGKFSNKGWDFKDEPLEAITRKIRYVRFGQEEDPLFVKVGGLSSVTFGYGFIIDRFTNMLHYPDEKQLGLQFYLNDISPIGISLQTMIADFKDFKDDGGVLGARLAFRPLKMTDIPIVSKISIGGTYAKDLNQYAPARRWKSELADDEKILVELRDGGFMTDSLKSHLVNKGVDVDEKLGHVDEMNSAKKKEDDFGLIGGDIGIPIISTKFFGVDLYGQAGMRDDGEHGWGIGAPGIAFKVWKLWGNVEYRKTRGRFTPGYFDSYYLDERLTRTPDVYTKEDLIPEEDLDGVYGKLGFNIANVLIIDGAYQYLLGDNDTKDQRFEGTASIGELILQKVPKINKAEFYYSKSNIGVYDEDFFEKSEFQYLGYRVGFEISQGASLIWDSRYGYKRNNEGKLESDNFISVLTAITF